MSAVLRRPATAGVSLHELTAGLGVASPGDDDPLVTGVSLDSRRVQPGDLYAALPGFTTHGAEFAEQAFGRGAVAVLTDPDGAARMPATGGSVVVVDRPRDVLGAVSAQVYGHPARGLTMLGVTGTNGKTTTAYLIEAALRALGQRTGLIGTVETRIGEDTLYSERTTPEAPDVQALLATMAERGVDTCVMEVSSHALGLHRVDAVVYDVALFTNLSQDHLDFHATMDDYYAAKASLFTPEHSRSAIVCVDDAWGARLAREAEVTTTTLGTSASSTGADWRVEESELGRFVVREHHGPGRLHLVSHLPGHFNVANTALAALALLAIGLSPEQVETAMAVAPDVPGRMQVVTGRTPDAPRCIVDFAHTPDAIAAALAAVRPSTTGRLVAVLGAGGDRDQGKRAGMGEAAARWADVVIVTDDNPRSEDPAQIRAAVLAGARAVGCDQADGATELIEVGSRAEAITAAVGLAAAADTVVVLGKGHEKGQEVAGVTYPFDDRDAVLSALESRAAPSAAASPTVRHRGAAP